MELYGSFTTKPYSESGCQEGKKMPKPITVEYLWLYNEPFGGYRRVHTSETYEDYHRVVRILHENEDKYKVISVTR